MRYAAVEKLDYWTALECLILEGFKVFEPVENPVNKRR